MYYSGDVQTFLPTILSSEYFVEPSIVELAERETVDPGYCGRVPNLVIGRVGFGCIKFHGHTDVRWMNLDNIVKFDRNYAIVYENERDKPPVGQGLNKTAEVTLILRLRLANSHGLESNKTIEKLRKCTDRQGAKFVSFDQSNCEWKFFVDHFSRFGLREDEEDDIIIDDTIVQPTAEEHEGPPGEKHVTPLSGMHSSNIADAALFMGRSFRVGWGPKGVLAHTGIIVGKIGCELSSIIHVQRIAIDLVVRDEQNKVREELVDLCFSSPLILHRSLNHDTMEFEVDSYKLKLQKIICSRSMLPEICAEYACIIKEQLKLSGLPASILAILRHQVMIWSLIDILFSNVVIDGKLNIFPVESVIFDPEAIPFVRKTVFSHWWQLTVRCRPQIDVSHLSDSAYLLYIQEFLSGRQLDAVVKLAVSRGDVRLAILLSQAGGFMLNRANMAQQLDLWKANGLNFSTIKNDRFRLYELLAGNIEEFLQDSTIDWKRHLGLVMWYQLPPDTALDVIFHTYKQLLSEGRATHPVPEYMSKGPAIDEAEWRIGDYYDIAYYLMLLYANEDEAFGLLQSMFSASSSTSDPLDYHLIWHQRAILESIGAFSSNDLHIVDISFISQLLCLGLCHWAIYVVIHMPCYDGFPHIHVKLLKEILLQYCETWSTSEAQRQFIVDLGVPSAWMHEALATYHRYYGDLPKALEHYLECSKWQEAHSLFMSGVAHSLFLSSKHSEIRRIATIMQEHKSEIFDWDKGARIYIDFYDMRSSFEKSTPSESGLFAKINEDCRNFFSWLNESVQVWGSRLLVDVRHSQDAVKKRLALIFSEPRDAVKFD